jgi:hypothetical protein
MRRSYLSVVGDSWAAALAWRRTFPDEPFLGVRFDGRTAWVLFAPKTTGGPLRPMLTRAIRQAFEEAGGGWIDENVFIYEAPSLGAGHRFARLLVRMLRSGASREAETSSSRALGPSRRSS